MSANLICPQCGFANRTVGVFCTSCGARMGEPELKKAPRRFPVGRFLGGAVRLLVVLALAAGIGMLAWPRDVPPVAPDPDAGERVAAQVRTLRQAAERGTTARQVFSESDINGYLAWRLQETQAVDRGPGLGLTLERMHLSVSDPVCTFRLLARVAGLRLSLVTDVRPEVREGRLRFETERAWIGHLPVPARARRWVLRKQAPVFAELDDERFVADRTQRVELGPGLVGIEVR